MSKPVEFEVVLTDISKRELNRGWNYDGVREYEDEVEFWFVRERESLKREFSIWRFFELNSKISRLLWRTGVAIGNGRVHRGWALATFNSPREFERAVGKVGLGLSKLKYIELTSTNVAVAGVADYTMYRDQHELDMFIDAWRGLARNAEADRYLEVLDIANANDDILISVLTANETDRRSVISAANDLSLPVDRLVRPIAAGDSLSNHRAIVALATLVKCYRPNMSLGEMAVCFSLGEIWADNWPERFALRETLARIIGR